LYDRFQKSLRNDVPHIREFKTPLSIFGSPLCVRSHSDSMMKEKRKGENNGCKLSRMMGGAFNLFTRQNSEPRRPSPSGKLNLHKTRNSIFLHYVPFIQTQKRTDKIIPPGQSKCSTRRSRITLAKNLYSPTQSIRHLTKSPNFQKVKVRKVGWETFATRRPEV
jgi:hypothetical protein